MIILGINAVHADSAAALIRDGRLVAAAEEERFRRIKHFRGFPSRAVRYCLDEAGVRLEDVHHIAINQNSKANIWRKFGYGLRHPSSAGLIIQRLRNRSSRANLPRLFFDLDAGAFRGEYHSIEHHLSHLYSAYYVSPFQEAAVLSVDGFGDFSSAMWGAGVAGDIRIHRKVYFPHSLGIFYQSLTQYLGFPHYGDEYKVMGLAPYGSPSYLDEMREIVSLHPRGRFELNLKYFLHHNGEMPYSALEGSAEIENIFTQHLEELLGPRRMASDAIAKRHWDIARSTQAMYEEAFFHIVKNLEDETGLTDLALAGGCAANSVANGKVRRQSKFRRVYVQSAAGDAGGAIGAAFAVWHGMSGARSFVMDHAYWGPHFSDQQIADVIGECRDVLAARNCSIETISDDAALCRRAAGAIAQGRVLGWFQGRMEWGPRALGNRSILCDPRRADMKEILNAKIKRRESFRPFAPSILETEVGEWFEEDDAVPFMMQVFQVREEKRPLIPAVTHVDGSGRLQTVSKSANPLYFRLLEAFRALTAVPMLLNTSFNENEPVVCTPREALDCFIRTKMDVLVLGQTYIERRDA